MPQTRSAFLLSLPLVSMLCLLSTACRSQPGPSEQTARPAPRQQTTSRDPQAATHGPRLAAVGSEPAVRVRIGTRTQSVQIAGSSALQVGPGQADAGKSPPRPFAGPVTIRRDTQGFLITDGRGVTVRWALATLNISAGPANLGVDGKAYPGSIELVTTTTTDGRQLTRLFDIVNHVGMEAYLPGVLSKELYASWHPEAYRAQAVAARSYAIWEMNLPRRRAVHFDLEASEASQAYIGAAASDKAKQAVRDTRGLVLTYNRRVLPAFYSSATGGSGQDAVAAFPGRVADLAPLRGKPQGGWGQASNRFTWGPVNRNRSTLSRRIARWGQADDNPVASLGTVQSIRIIASNSVGRPTTFRITDTHGQSYDLPCEKFRNACNFGGIHGLSTLSLEEKLLSSHVTVTLAGDTVRFTGRGFGHGVGMGQWGAQGMATSGHGHRAILGFYYPSADIQRAY